MRHKIIMLFVLFAALLSSCSLLKMSKENARIFSQNIINNRGVINSLSLDGASAAANINTNVRIIDLTKKMSRCYSMFLNKDSVVISSYTVSKIPPDLNCMLVCRDLIVMEITRKNKMIYTTLFVSGYETCNNTRTSGTITICYKRNKDKSLTLVSEEYSEYDTNGGPPIEYDRKFNRSLKKYDK